jgi:hypothetical protein
VSPSRFVVEFQQGTGPTIARLVDGSHRFTSIDAIFTNHQPHLKVRVYAENAEGAGRFLRSTPAFEASFCIGDMNSDNMITQADLAKIIASYSTPAPGVWKYSGLYFDTPLENIDWSESINTFDWMLVSKRFFNTSCVATTN